jgi:hypothetical protein
MARRRRSRPRPRQRLFLELRRNSTLIAFSELCPATARARQPKT